MLDYERLDAYQCALRFTALSFRILEAIPRGHADLADQLRRASISVPLNIAEGSGKTTARERSRFHAIARGSAMECAAVIDLLVVLKLVDDAATEEAKALAVRVVSMLSRMCR